MENNRLIQSDLVVKHFSHKLSLLSFLVILMTIFQSCGGGNTNTGNCLPASATTYTGKCTIGVGLQIKRIMIKVRKDVGIFNGGPKDDVWFAANMYENNSPASGMPLIHEITKVSPNDQQKWLSVNYALTPAEIFLCPNSTIAFMLYDDDNTSTFQTWEYAPNYCLKVNSKETPYLRCHIQYSAFVNLPLHGTVTYTQAEGEVEIERIY